MTAERITDKTIQEQCADTSKRCIVTIEGRPGSLIWMTDLEYSYFEPDTPRNDLFQIYLMKWEDINWSIVQIPAEDFNIAQEFAAKYNLRFADGVPMVISGGGQVLSRSRTTCVYLREQK